MQKRIWSQYNKELVKRGSIQCFIEEKTLGSILEFKGKSCGGRPEKFPQALIQILLVLKIQYSLSYRALEGFAKSVLKAIGIPHYSLICKRAKALARNVPELTKRRPKVVLIDSTGIKICGEGEWKRKIHGRGGPRRWKKLHIAVDENTQEVVAAFVTDCHVGDATALEDLLQEAPRSVEIVKADGAYDRRCAKEAARKRNIELITPPPKNARVRGVDKKRDDAILAIKGFGDDKLARALWGKCTGYNYRVLAETAFSRYKRIFGGRLFSQTAERQSVENCLKWMILNKMRQAA